jgi:hypothetical protein
MIPLSHPLLLLSHFPEEYRASVATGKDVRNVFAVLLTRGMPAISLGILEVFTLVDSVRSRMQEPFVELFKSLRWLSEFVSTTACSILHSVAWVTTLAADVGGFMRYVLGVQETNSLKVTSRSYVCLLCVQSAVLTVSVEVRAGRRL